jgi:hypothetical protein
LTPCFRQHRAHNGKKQETPPAKHLNEEETEHDSSRDGTPFSAEEAQPAGIGVDAGKGLRGACIELGLPDQRKIEARKRRAEGEDRMRLLKELVRGRTNNRPYRPFERTKKKRI